MRFKLEQCHPKLFVSSLSVTHYIQNQETRKNKVIKTNCRNLQEMKKCDKIVSTTQSIDKLIVSARKVKIDKKLQQKLSQIDWLNFHFFDRFAVHQFAWCENFTVEMFTQKELWLNYIGPNVQLIFANQVGTMKSFFRLLQRRRLQFYFFFHSNCNQAYFSMLVCIKWTTPSLAFNFTFNEYILSSNFFTKYLQHWSALKNK